MHGLRQFKGKAAVAAAATVLTAGLGVLPFADVAPRVLPERQAEIEADWQQQDRARAAGTAAVTPAEDAAGACDGVKDGKWGFHTNLDAEPWWQVDLGSIRPLDRIVVYNRCDAASRADSLRISLSNDGAAWERVYAHSGPTFFGATDGKPLVVPMNGKAARYVRCSVPGPAFLHLDEVEVYAADAAGVNIALGRPCLQSSISQWSYRSALVGDATASAADILKRGRALVAELKPMGVNTSECERALDALAAVTTSESPQVAGLRQAPRSADHVGPALKNARWAIRRLMLSHPLLSFDSILFVKRRPGSFNHMSDQHYGWWSRGGGGLYVLTGFREDRPTVREIATGLPLGSYVDPDLSYDGRRILFGYCRFYADSQGRADKTDKLSIPEDAFYHLYEMNLDGSGLRRLTYGRYDDFSGRYLPDGSIAFLSTRRGATVQYAGTRPIVPDTAAANERPVPGGGTAGVADARPDSFVRCGGDRYRPVSVYTLHVLSPDRKNVRAISPFENFEWTPNVCSDGRILYARWDYVDRDNMPYMKLWSTNPDGTNPQAVFGNYTGLPHCTFEARPVPGSRKILCTASAHHAVTGGSLIMLDPDRGMDGREALTRLTPEVPFPEVEAWPASYFMSPYPLSETLYLTSWSTENIAADPPSGLGIYLRDAHGNQELLYRDPDISSMYAMPIRPRPVPPVIASATAPDSEPALALVTNVYEGLERVYGHGDATPTTGKPPIRWLRIVAVPAKTQPEMNSPNLGLTSDDPGKCVLGTVPVERDGSAYFHLPAGVPVFFQALDAEGIAVQTMRTVTYAQPGKKLACVGCHEPRNRPGRNRMPLAMRRAPSRITPGPEGSWPYRFDKLVQPVLDARCVSCHAPGGSGAGFDLRPQTSYESLVSYGRPSLREHVQSRYHQGRSIAGEGAAATSPLLALLRKGHQGVHLGPNELERFTTWMDTYAQRLGSFGPAQEAELTDLRRRWAPILTP
jgi:hypothetical protein